MATGIDSASVRAPATVETQPSVDIVELNRWQSDHIRHALKQADAGEFVADDEVADALDRWRS